MKKMTTLFVIDRMVKPFVLYDEIREENEWVMESGIPTRKWDGTACLIKDGEIYKRYDAKRGKTPPVGSIPCIKEKDPITGHWPHWAPCDKNNNSDRWHFEGFDNLEVKEDGTYELCGPKVQGNVEHLEAHTLIKHGADVLNLTDFRLNSIKKFLEENDLEGIVFHDKNGTDRMCKIRKSDFRIER